MNYKRFHFFSKLILILSLFFIVLTMIPFIYSHQDKIYDSVHNLSNIDSICLLGARVYKKGVLSPVIKQRCDALIKINQEFSRIKIIISGSGSYEVNHIYWYLLRNNLNPNRIMKDYYGYDTHDSIRYMNQSGFKRVLFVSQSFHLFRAIEMADDDGLSSYGLAAEKLAPVTESISIWEKYSIIPMVFLF